MKINFLDVLEKYEYWKGKSVLGEFSSGVSICYNKGTRSDLGILFLLEPPGRGVQGALPPALSSRQVIAVAAVHTNLKVSKHPSARGISLMEMLEMLWKRCRASKRLKSLLCHHWSTEERPRETYWGIFPGVADIWCFNWVWIYVRWRYWCC